jgi:DNA adenine methylase
MSCSPPLKWHGGKYYLAPKIVALMPAHVHYVEPFAGGLAVLLAHPGEGRSELVNDLDQDLVNFWRVLRSPDLFPDFLRLCQSTPLARDEWDLAGRGLGTGADGLWRAWGFFVRCRQSLRRPDGPPSPRSPGRRTRRGHERAGVSAWLDRRRGATRGARAAAGAWSSWRTCPALDAHPPGRTARTLCSTCDPPYLHETRAATDAYAHEMSDADHAKLLVALSHVEGKFLLSGYDSEMYRKAERVYGWNRHTFDLPNNAAGGGEKRRMTEVLWTNF